MNLNNSTSLFLIYTHALLSVSSFIFHIPSKRNPSKPMIYPEFRLHSILFALRSVIISSLYYYNSHYIYIIGICYLTFISADIISYYYKENNGTTMRNMPFDSTIPIEVQNKITFMHSCMQIGATVYMLGNIETAFSPLFAIQIAALLMTLVRKSIITSKMWHAVYSITLWVNMILFLTLPIGYILINQIMYLNYKNIFFHYKINKYIAWSINFSLYMIYKEYNIDKFLNNSTEIFNDYIYYIKLIFILINLFKLFKQFKILFTY
jgi:hypothetical protein